MPSTKHHPVSTNPNTPALITDAAKTGPPPNPKVLAAMVFLGFLVFTGCGGGYQNARPPNQPPNQNSLAQIQVIASAVPSIQISDTVRLYASAGYQNSPNSVTYTDVTNSATWSTSDPAVATVSNGVVTVTGSGPVTIAASYGGKSGATTVVVGLTSTIAISPRGPFSMSATPNVSFVAKATYSDGTVLDLTNFADWTSSPTGILTFDFYFPGYATFGATGTTTIAATLPTGEVATLAVTVGP
jgi:hypothetical protein